MGDRETGHWPLLFMMSSRSSSSKSTEEEKSEVRTAGENFCFYTNDCSRKSPGFSCMLSFNACSKELRIEMMDGTVTMRVNICQSGFYRCIILR